MINVPATDYDNWDILGLQDFGDFSDKITCCNETDLGDCSKGDWFYIPDEPVDRHWEIVGEVPDSSNFRAIYSGTYDWDHAPGSSSQTYADLYDLDDPEDAAAFEAAKREWESSPEIL